MKNFIKMSIVVGLTILCGCISSGDTMLDEVVDSVNTDTVENTATDSADETVTDSADDTVMDSGDDTVAEATTGNVIVAEDGVGIGEIGDLMQTAFLNYTVNSAYVTETFDTITASDGYKLLVANVTVANTTSYTITMIESDFMVMWDVYDDESDDNYSWPLCEYIGEEGNESDYTQYEVLSDQQLPTYYDLAVYESIKGNLVFEVDEDASEYYLVFEEYYSDGTTGDIYGVWFTLE